MTGTTQDFIVNRADLSRTKWVSGPAPDDIALDKGQILAEIEKYAFTANNITYGAMRPSCGRDRARLRRVKDFTVISRCLPILSCSRKR